MIALWYRFCALFWSSWRRLWYAGEDPFEDWDWDTMRMRDD